MLPGDQPICGRRQFPPLAQLRRREEAGQPWKTVVIGAQVSAEYRPNILGPLSLFFNESGCSEVALRGRVLPLHPQNFAVSAAGERFTLVYPEETTTRALNVYFADDLVSDVAGSRTRPAQLDAAQRSVTAGPQPMLRPINAALGAALDQVRGCIDAGGVALEEAVIRLLDRVLARPPDVDVRTLRSATRDELRRRLARTLDYLVAYSHRDLGLAELAVVCGLSRFHFLRLFKDAVGTTPSRYLTRVRLERAQALLLRSERPIGEIALEVGFSEQSALSRAFMRQVGMSPGGFRKLRAVG